MIPVEGHKNLFRDEKTNAIVNTDNLAYENYISMRRKNTCLLYTSPSPRDRQKSRMPSSA